MDGYNGDFDVCLCFFCEVLVVVCVVIFEDFIVGLCLFVDECDFEGFSESELLQVVEVVQGELDYLYIVVGILVFFGGVIYIVLLMVIELVYLVCEVGIFKVCLVILLFVIGCINQFQEVEVIFV